MNTTVKLNNLRLELDDAEAALSELAAARLGLGAEAVSRVRILRKSLDARRADDLHFNYALELELPAEDAARALAAGGPDVRPFREQGFLWPEPGANRLEHRPVVIGAGPAGLIAGYMLALHGYRPLVLERGRRVKERVADVRKFNAGGPVDAESNYLFGEGGAGTFSDGKLTSRGGGPDVRKVLEILSTCKAKPSILYEHRPHLGSNRLPLVVKNLREKLEAMGGEVRFSCRVEDLDLVDGRLRGLGTSSGYVPADVAILAMGHSARDVYHMLLRRRVPIVAKPFQFGVRVEQPQEQIDQVRHGASKGHPALGAADYALNVRAGDCDLFTFCMCSGGYVMPSVSEPGYWCSNGMSESRHDSPFANSGLVVTVDPTETSSHPLAGVHFQQRHERAAYIAGGRSHAAPIQWARDFLAGRASRGTVASSYMRGEVRPMDLGPLLPERVVRALVKGLPMMDRRMDRRFLRDATLTGPESRGSSPVRIPRDPATLQSPAAVGLYPCGEGAGYAGGIVSAAVDGLRVARALVAAFAPPG